MARKKVNGFGAWLDATLSNAGITGRTLAGKVGVDDSVVSRWRAGQGTPSPDRLPSLAEILDVDPLRLAVTVGVVPAAVAGVKPLAPPPPTARRKAVREQIGHIKGLTRSERETLLQTYTELTEER